MTEDIKYILKICKRFTSQVKFAVLRHLDQSNGLPFYVDLPKDAESATEIYSRKNVLLRSILDDLQEDIQLELLNYNDHWRIDVSHKEDGTEKFC